MDSDSRTMTVSETVRISGVYDVVVCGGGPAGIAAAIAAARKGASTLLIEQLSYLGGMASGSFINAWCDTQTGPIAAELEARLADLGAATRHYDPEKHLCETGRMTFQSHMMAVVSLSMLREAGAEILFGAVAEGVWLDRGKVTGVFIANKNGRSLVQASVVIDATADGDMAVSAGADFMRGDPDDGRIQHVHYRFRISGAEHIAAAQKKLSSEELLTHIREARNEGRLTPPSGMFRPGADTFPYHSPDGCLYVNRWEIENVDPSDARAVSRCLTECQLAALQVMEFCQKRLPGCASCRIEQLPGLLGTRESRRILGEYVLCKDDVLSGRKFEDGIAKCCFFIDLHDSPPGLTVPFTMDYKRSAMPTHGDWYEIPYRCLIPKGIEGLLVAGRCFSCDRAAQGSARLQPTCMYLGEAAGIAASIAAKENIPPHRVDGRRVREEIGMDKDFQHLSSLGSSTT